MNNILTPTPILATIAGSAGPPKRRKLLKRPSTPVVLDLPTLVAPQAAIPEPTNNMLEVWEDKVPWLKDIIVVPKMLMVAPSPNFILRANYKNDHMYREVREGLYIPVRYYKDLTSLVHYYTATSPRQPPLPDSLKTYYRYVSLEFFGNENMFSLTAKFNEFAIPAANQTRKNLNEISILKIPSTNSLTRLFAILHGMVELSIGQDPEFFPTTKFPTEASAHHEVFYADGYAWEWRTVNTAPSRCMALVISRFGEITMFTEELDLIASPRLELTPEIVASVSPEQRTLGCNPSENAYGMQGNLAEAETVPYRWAGGHLHFGLPLDAINEDCILRCVKNLDTILGPAMVSMVGKYDDPARRKYYGLAGEYRTKPYGFEYRVPSNQIWIKSLHYFTLMEIGRLAVKLGVVGLTFEDIGMDITTDEAIFCINTNNVEHAREIIKRNASIYAAIFDSKTSVQLDTNIILQLLQYDPKEEHAFPQNTITPRTLKEAFGFCISLSSQAGKSYTTITKDLS